MPRSLNKNEIANFRNQLCAAAETLYESKGAAGVTMRELAQTLHVSAMTPYRYFRDKNEIFACLQTQAIQQFVAFLRKTCDASTSFILAAEHKARAYVTFRNTHPRLYRLMSENFGTESFAYLTEARHQAVAEMEIRTTTLPDADNGRTHTEFSRILLSSLHGACALHDIGALSDSPDLTDFCTRMTQILASGYLGRPAATPQEPAEILKPETEKAS